MKALEGLKILDFTTLLPGPYATLVLADLGAEVLKVSSPSKQDIVLEYEPFVEGTDIAANEAWLGRNKRNIFLNLKHPKAIAIVKQLIQEYDIVIEQFRPGVMEKLGLGYEALKAVNPALIYCLPAPATARPAPWRKPPVTTATTWPAAATWPWQAIGTPAPPP